ncbi:hypothetical protein [Sedimentibacter sp.]|uniref:hypothetical protein n=1 Tax=Sedimentibacter sp. TaxID=1960295 RepID=UPI0028A1D697|nr:hypothetical protein [Sedimentibacter sp.]
MRKRKIKIIFLVITVLAVMSVLVGCSKDNEKETATSFLRILYEANDYENYEKAVERKLSIADEKTAGSDFIGIVPFSDEENREIFGHYIDKYAPLVTKDGLDKLFASGLITYMDDLAYTNDLYTKVEKIELDKTEEHEYAYTVKLKLVKDNKEAAGECTGIVGMAQDEDGSYKVNFLKKTDSKVINDMMYKVSN